MGKDLKGKELGKGISQRKNKMYCGRFVNRFGNRESVYDEKLSVLRDKLNKAIYEDKTCMNVIDSNITLNDWYVKWMGIYKSDEIRPNTKRQYETVFHKHISPKLGAFPITNITQLQIKALIKQLKENGYKYETQNKVRVLLLDMFNKALIDEFVVRNPAKGIRLKRDEKKEPRVLSVEEQMEFFQCCDGTFYDNAFVTHVNTGLRPGELWALEEDDLDFQNKTISIHKTLLYEKWDGDEKKCFKLGPPKTEASIRKVPMNHTCEIALKKQIVQKHVIASKAPKSKRPADEFLNLLFTTKYNTPINSEIYCGAIQKVINEINLRKHFIEEFEHFSGHCFRHTFATRCFESEIKPKTVQKYLGHATLQMTMDLYTHILEETQLQELQKMEQLFAEINKMDDDIVNRKYEDIKKNEENLNNLIDFNGVRLA